MEVRIIGNMDNTIDHTFESANIQPKVIEETECVGGLTDSLWGGKQHHQQDRVYKGDIALAEPANIPGGSYKYIVAMRGRGENNEQQLEPNTQGRCQRPATVQKDNLVMETPRYRIRKLSPRECWRLMGYTDEDFDRAAKVNSQTQLYKQAGNAIVKQVLMAIFLQMNIQGLKPWNDRNEDEIRELIK